MLSEVARVAVAANLDCSRLMVWSRGVSPKLCPRLECMETFLFALRNGLRCTQGNQQADFLSEEIWQA